MCFMNAVAMCKLWRDYTEVELCFFPGTLSCVACRIFSRLRTMQEREAVKGSRGKANLVAKCKLCSRENTLR